MSPLTLSGMDPLSGQATLSNLFCLPSEKGSTLNMLKGTHLLPLGPNAFLLEKGSKFFPFRVEPFLATGDQEVAGSTPAEVGNILSWRLIMNGSTVILSLPLIQEGQLSVSGERMCTILVNRLED